MSVLSAAQRQGHRAERLDVAPETRPVYRCASVNKAQSVKVDVRDLDGDPLKFGSAWRVSTNMNDGKSSDSPSCFTASASRAYPVKPPGMLTRIRALASHDNR